MKNTKRLFYTSLLGLVTGFYETREEAVRVTEKLNHPTDLANLPDYLVKEYPPGTLFLQSYKDQPTWMTKRPWGVTEPVVVAKNVPWLS
jgi:hypothetical protein